MTNNASVVAVKTITAVAAATVAFSPAPLSASAWASPTTPVVPHPQPVPGSAVQQPTQVHVPAPINVPRQAPAPPPPVQHTAVKAPPPVQHTATQAPPPAQHTASEAPPQHTVTAEPSAPEPSPTPTHRVQPSEPSPTLEHTATSAAPRPGETRSPTQSPGATEPSATAPAPGHTATASAPPETSEPRGTHGAKVGPSVNPSRQTTGPSGHESAVIPRGDTSITVPVASPPKPIPAPQEAVEAARVAPAALIDPAQPPPLPAKVDFNKQIQTAIRGNVDHDKGVYRPQHWDYVDYDAYHRATLFNPLGSDVTFRYFCNGAYQTVWIPPGGRVLLNMDTPGVFPFTVAAGELVSVGSFLGGAWIPPADWAGPPPVDWQPWAPVTYSAVPVDFADLGQTVMVDEVTEVGHDDTLPVGQRDVVMLNDSSLARGEIHPDPDGGPPHITLQKTQQLPGVSPWNNGQDLINTSVEKPAATPKNHLPWVIGGLAAVLALVGGVAAWVWKHPRGAHALANTATGDAPTEIFDPASRTDWLHDSRGGPHSEFESTGGAWRETDTLRRRRTR